MKQMVSVWGEAGCMHCYAAQYAEGTQCTVVFVPYRTSDTAPFPTPFQYYCAALRWVWDNAPSLRVGRSHIAAGGGSAGRAPAAACAQALQAAGTDVQFENVSGTFHGFDFFVGKETSRAMARKRIQALRQAFE